MFRCYSRRLRNKKGTEFVKRIYRVLKVSIFASEKQVTFGNLIKYLFAFAARIFFCREEFVIPYVEPRDDLRRAR